MRSPILACFIAALALAAAPAYAGDLTFTLDSSTGSGSPTNLNPDADICVPPNCALFTGALFDTDTDDSYLFLDSIGVTFSSNPVSGSLTIDNTFYDDFPGILSGDPDYATDDLGNPPNIDPGDLFGIDIAPGTSSGVYTGTVTIDAAGGTDDPNDNGFIVTQDITVVVTPEPPARSLALAGLLALAVSYRLKSKWHSSEASR
jgi:hypothetical protein